MLKKVNRKSLKREIIWLSVISFCIAAAFYIGVVNFGDYAASKWWNNEKHVVQLEHKKIKELQKFIDKNKLSLDDMEKIDDWVYKQDILFIKIYADNRLVYDSLYGVISSDGKAMPEELSDLKNQSTYRLQFSDKQAVAMFAGIEDYDIYLAIDIGAIILAFLIFIIILIFGISKKVKYVTEITNDLSLMATDLSHEITVKGNDDLTYVAVGINQLRETVINKMQSEQAAYRSNRDLVTSLAHDIRTPLTAIIAYLEISVNRKDLDEETLKNINICLERAYRLKDITDELFDYFLLDKSSYQVAFDYVNGNEVVAQFLEEHLYEIQSKGVKINRSIADVRCKLKVNVNLLARFFDNIFSNIGKYADLEKELEVKYGLKDQYLYMGVKNYKNFNEKSFNSSRIGIKNCKAIAELHGGFTQIENGDDTFEIILFLPVDKL